MDHCFLIAVQHERGPRKPKFLKETIKCGSDNNNNNNHHHNQVTTTIRSLSTSTTTTAKVTTTTTATTIGLANGHSIICNHLPGTNIDNGNKKCFRLLLIMILILIDKYNHRFSTIN